MIVILNGGRVPSFQFRIPSMQVALLLCFISLPLRAQFAAPSPQPPASGFQLQLETAFGKFDIESEIETSFAAELDPSNAERGTHKSPYLAAALSLVIPGLGEYYVGDEIWRGAIFTAADAGLWFGHFTYLARGDDSTAAFEAFANEHWLPARYADTLNFFLNIAGVGWQISPKDDFGQINRAEDTLSRFVQSFPLSHRLPPKGSQQYYELISKYLQFEHGWDDHISGGPSPNYLRHADMRANMNYQYEVADYFLFGLILNRVLSAIDAVLLVKDHNSALRVQGELRALPGNELVPTAKLRYRF